MPQDDHTLAGQPFIPEELRPDLSGYFDSYPVVPPTASREKIERAAGSVLTQAELKELALTDIWFPEDAWDRAIERHPDVIWAMTADGEAVLLHMGEGLYFGLDPVGAAIWESLADAGSARAILTAMSHAYGWAEERLAPDLAAFFAMLVHKALITLSDTVTAQTFLRSQDDGPEWPTYGQPTLMEHGSLVELTAAGSKNKEKDKDKDKEKEDKFF
jgi:hypothetical protein